MIRTRIIETPLMPRGNIVAITLFGLVFTPCRQDLDTYMVNHELIHCQQQLECLYIPFFVLYLLEWLIGLIRFQDTHKAYRNISFEREAYAHQSDLNYLNSRPFYANYRHKE